MPHTQWSSITSFCFPSRRQPQRQDQQSNVRSNTQSRQDHHDIPTSPESLSVQPVIADLVEELPVSLLPTVGADDQDSSSVDSEECSYTIEFGREDLEHHEGEGELR